MFVEHPSHTFEGGKGLLDTHPNTIAYCLVYCTVLYCTVQYFTVMVYIEGGEGVLDTDSNKIAYCLLYYAVLYCTVLYCTVLYWAISNEVRACWIHILIQKIENCIVFCCIVMFILLYQVISKVVFWNALHCVGLQLVVFYCIVLSWIVLFYTVSYFIVLFNIVLHCIWLCRNVMFCFLCKVLQCLLYCIVLFTLLYTVLHYIGICRIVIHFIVLINVRTYISYNQLCLKVFWSVISLPLLFFSDCPFTNDSKTGFGIFKLHREVGRLFAYVGRS